MKNRHNFKMLLLIAFALLLNPGCRKSDNISPTEQSHSATNPLNQEHHQDSQNSYPTLSGPGEKIKLGTDHYFTYGFTTPPKMGSVIMKVAIFTQDGKKDTSFVVKGDVDMPSMRGAHSMGNKDFSISEKGDYLLPVSLVMPGDWEFRFSFVKDGETLFRGAYLFDL